VVATPIASLPAVDRMHLFADDIVCLSVISNWFSTNHYYDDNTIPATERLFDLMRNISLNWDRKTEGFESLSAAPMRQPKLGSSDGENYRHQPEVFHQ